jgi:hypothetical protein
MAPMTFQQQRGRSIAMTPGEVDDFLGGERTARIATAGPDGPHATPLWFVWHGGALWLYSLTRSKRWADLRRDPRVAALVDAGAEYVELRGVELRGRVEVVGEVPRTGRPLGVLAEPERLFARKYFGSEQMGHDERHGWLRLVPEQILSWDFRKRFGPP